MGIVERHHLHLVDTAITLLQHVKLLNSYWDFGVMTACFLYNRNPSSILDDISPLEALLALNQSMINLDSLVASVFLESIQIH